MRGLKLSHRSSGAVGYDLAAPFNTRRSRGWYCRGRRSRCARRVSRVRSSARPARRGCSRCRASGTASGLRLTGNRSLSKPIAPLQPHDELKSRVRSLHQQWPTSRSWRYRRRGAETRWGSSSPATEGGLTSDKSVAAGLSANGVAVVGWSSLAYYWTPRSSPAAATDLNRIIEQYTTAWRRPHVLIIGYSFGADVAPFLINRLPASTRGRVAAVTLLGPSGNASFEFHVADCLCVAAMYGTRSVRRSNVYPSR